MRIKDINGRAVSKSFLKYRVDWDKSVSKPQKMVKDALRPFWGSDEVYEELVIPSSRLRVDLINFTKMIAVEVSPSSSHEYNDFFNKNRSNYLASKKRELKKFNWLEINCIKWVEITDVGLKNFDWLDDIK